MKNLPKFKKKYSKEIDDTILKINNKIQNKNFKLESTHVNLLAILLVMKRYLQFDRYNFVTFVQDLCYGLKVKVKENQLFRDFCQYCMNILYIWFHNIKKNDCCYEIDLDCIHERYIDSIKDVDNRMWLRIELFKIGWTPKYIEKIIIKLYELDNYLEDINDDQYNLVMHNICQILNYEYIPQVDLLFPITLIRLPSNIAEFLQKIKKEKANKKNCERRKLSNSLFKTLKNNLLTSEELSLIKEKITDDTIINKLSHLVKKE